MMTLPDLIDQLARYEALKEFGGKTTVALLKSIRAALQGEKVQVLTRESGSQVINRLRAFDIDCELDGNKVNGTMDKQPWQITLSYVENAPD